MKEGKIGRKDGQPLPGEDEPLHAFITATTQDSVLKAVAKIKEIIRQGVEVPENQNDLRRMQLRELALLNGTLRESDGPRCSNCGSTAHRSWQCPDKPNVTNNVVCTNCNGVGHIAKDCKEKKSGSQGPVNQAKIDEEYLSFMSELGEKPVPSKSTLNPLASTVSLGPTIGLTSSAPKPLTAPTTQTLGTSHTTLLPTPPSLQPTQPQTSWGAQQSQGWNNSYSTGYESYNNSNIYSQTLPWLASSKN